jgi:hypothetical protein
VLVHPDFVTVVYLPDKIEKALASDTQSYEVKPIGATSLAIRPLKADAKPANLALATASIKVSVVLRMAQSRDAAMTQVTFKRADVEAELERRIAEKVKARTAELEAKVAAMQQQMDAELPKLADGLIAARILQRRDLRTLERDRAQRRQRRGRDQGRAVPRRRRLRHLRHREPQQGALPASRPSRCATAPRDTAGVVRFTSDAAETAGAGVARRRPPGRPRQGRRRRPPRRRPGRQAR